MQSTHILVKEHTEYISPSTSQRQQNERLSTGPKKMQREHFYQMMHIECTLRMFIARGYVINVTLKLLEAFIT